MIQKIEIVNLQPSKTAVASVSGQLQNISGYSLWEYQNSQWQMKQDDSKTGFRASSPPVSPGAFEGQVRALLSEPVMS